MMKFLEIASVLLVYTSVCLYIIGATLCRGKQIIRGKHITTWGFMYLCYFVGACGELIDVWYFKSWDNTYTYELALLCGVALNLFCTRKLWAGGPPSSLLLNEG